jgi:hypothetical protein
VVGDENCDGIACSDVVWADGFAMLANGGEGLNVFAVDSQGNSFVSIFHTASVDFGNGIVSGTTDSVLAKIGPDGKALWSVDGMGFGRVAVTESGGVYVTQGTATAIGIAAYSGTGTLRWSTLWNAATTYITAIAPCGTNIAIAGRYSGALTLGSITLPAPPAGGTYGGTDGFVAMIYNPLGTGAGQPIWARQVTDVSGQAGADQSVNAIVCDAGGRVLLTGNFTTSVAIGSKTYVNVANNDFYVAALDTSGATQWLQPFGTASGTIVSDIAADSTGAPLVVGSTASGANFGGGLLINHGSDDGFMLKLNPAGMYQWSKLLGGAGADLFESAAFDANDNVVIAGDTTGPSVDLGSGLLPMDGMLLAKFDANGGYLWAKSFASQQEGDNPTVRVRPGANDIFFAAYNQDQLNLGTGPLGILSYDVVALGRFQP